VGSRFLQLRAFPRPPPVELSSRLASLAHLSSVMVRESQSAPSCAWRDYYVRLRWILIAAKALRCCDWSP
jgi:hypothetical protein